MRTIATILAVVFAQPVWAQAAVAIPQSTQTASAGTTIVNSDTAHLWECAVARNAGDIRWLSALRGNLPKLPDDQAKGALKNALDSSFIGCEAGASIDATSVIRLMLSSVSRYHPQSLSMPRRTDALANCLAKSMPESARSYLIVADKNPSGSAEQQKEAKSSSIKKMIEGSKDCVPQLDALENSINENELYSRLNWVLRAEPFFVASAVVASSSGVN